MYFVKKMPLALPAPKPAQNKAFRTAWDGFFEKYFSMCPFFLQGRKNLHLNRLGANWQRMSHMKRYSCNKYFHLQQWQNKTTTMV